jgi:murein DD-endopeptidase MepM/ murein hydrolase activator NlpD
VLQTQLLDAVTAATASRDAAQTRYDTVSREYRVAHDGYLQAKALVRDAQARAETAKAAAAASARALLLQLRNEGNPVPGGPPLSILFGSHGGTLLQRLGAMDRLGQLSAPPAELTERAQHDAAEAKRLGTAFSDAQAAAQAYPVDDKRAAMTAAKTDLDAAQSALDETQTRLSALEPTDAIPDFAADGLLDGLSWADPVRGPITDVFGPRPSRPAGTALFHPGVDIGAACWTWIDAAGTGTVVATGANGSYGNWVLIDHGSGIQTAYGHIADGGTIVSVGEQVVAGQPIAHVGTTGASTGCHLHLEVRVNGTQIDPQVFFAARGVILGQ